jgi:hypothetical protein
VGRGAGGDTHGPPNARQRPSSSRTAPAAARLQTHAQKSHRVGVKSWDMCARAAHGGTHVVRYKCIAWDGLQGTAHTLPRGQTDEMRETVTAGTCAAAVQRGRPCRHDPTRRRRSCSARSRPRTRRQLPPRDPAASSKPAQQPPKALARPTIPKTYSPKTAARPAP